LVFPRCGIIRHAPEDLVPMTENHSRSPLEGLWQMVRAELAGEPAPDMVAAKTTLELSGQRYTVRFDQETVDCGAFTVAGNVAHPRLILTGDSGPNRGRTVPAIYQCVRDRLRICYGLGGSLPVDFATAPGSELYLASYRRVVR
jgi:uncharacterized protein (TIGR03067 family)